MSTNSRARTAFFAFLTFAAFSTLLWTGSLVPAHAEEGGIPEAFDIDYGGKKPAVHFPHAAHIEVTECTTCHHSSEGLTAANFAEKNVQKCGACHSEPESDDVPDISSASAKKNAFHISCIGCHKDMAKENAELAAPTKCNDCHAKE